MNSCEKFLRKSGQVVSKIPLHFSEEHLLQRSKNELETVVWFHYDNSTFSNSQQRDVKEIAQQHRWRVSRKGE